jgi:two-component system, NtrC family, sensor kinase
MNIVGTAFLLFFLVRYVRRSYATAQRLPHYDKFIIPVFIGLAVIFLILDEAASFDEASNWYTMCVALLLIGILYSIKEYRPARTFATALLPFTVAVTVVNISKVLLDAKILEKFDSYIGLVMTCTFFWMLPLLYTARNQKRALTKEEKELEQALRDRQIAEARKAELEAMVNERTQEIMRQKESLEHALEELKAAQNQLIHAEKMASLGELMAGIAHEIQNPLNFVNNFSEVSVELMEELKEERLRISNKEQGMVNSEGDKVGKNTESLPVEQGTRNKEVSESEAIVDEILSDIEQNLQKISHHGKRAASIVKGMLQHSRTNTGQQEPTDLNLLADEYLRLSYHGLRAKDKSFNSDFKTELDPNLPKVNVIPQDFGRVLLNLINNAFYAVSERKVQVTDPQSAFQPMVVVRTRLVKHPDKKELVQISVKDNGTGMPESVKAKIFQPFYTTKPTGQGTGLGLSLAYDIVTKAHGGTLEVQSEEGLGTEFVISLPLKQS